MTKRKPATAGEILTEELMLTLCLAQAEAICVQSEHVNELCNNR